MWQELRLVCTSGRELASSALRAERHELSGAVAPVAPLLDDRGELVDLAGALSAADVFG
jgi:hypothetical protein